MSTLEKIFAEKLLNVKAIKLQPEQPFTWASGWKSPFYCDNRKTLAFPALRSFVKLELSRIVAEKYPEADAIAGVATGAIAQGALVADALGLPFAYVRSKPKDHGMTNLIEYVVYLTGVEVSARAATRVFPLDATLLSTEICFANSYGKVFMFVQI